MPNQSQAGTLQEGLDPQNLTAGTLKMKVWKMIFLFRVIFRFQPLVFRGVSNILNPNWLNKKV